MNPDSEFEAKPAYNPPGMFWTPVLAASAAYWGVLGDGELAPGTTRVLNEVAKPSVNDRVLEACGIKLEPDGNWGWHCGNVTGVLTLAFRPWNTMPTGK